MRYKEVDIEFLQQKIKDMEMETAKEVYALLEGMKIGRMETERRHPHEELEKIRREDEPYISEETQVEEDKKQEQASAQKKYIMEFIIKHYNEKGAEWVAKELGVPVEKVRKYASYLRTYKGIALKKDRRGRKKGQTSTKPKASKAKKMSNGELAVELFRMYKNNNEIINKELLGEIRKEFGNLSLKRITGLIRDELKREKKRKIKERMVRG